NAVTLLDRDGAEAAAEADHDARHAAVAYQQVGPGADHRDRDRCVESSEKVGEIGFVRRHEQDFGRPADAEPGEFGKIGVETEPASHFGQAAGAAPCGVGGHAAPARRSASAASSSGSAWAQWVMVPAPRQTTMSPGAAISAMRGARSD